MYRVGLIIIITLAITSAQSIVQFVCDISSQNIHISYQSLQYALSATCCSSLAWFLYTGRFAQMADGELNTPCRAIMTAHKLGTSIRTALEALLTDHERKTLWLTPGLIPAILRSWSNLWPISRDILYSHGRDGPVFRVIHCYFGASGSDRDSSCYPMQLRS